MPGPQSRENLNVSHSRFLAEGSRAAKWTDDPATPGNGGADSPAEDYDALPDGKGKQWQLLSRLCKIVFLGGCYFAS